MLKTGLSPGLSGEGCSRFWRERFSDRLDRAPEAKAEWPIARQ
jgi:hypothetical protein